jgi:hypothetical protein
MKLKHLVLILIFGTLIVACKKEKSLEEYMINSWQTTYMKIEMPTYEKSDSLYVYEDKFDNNPELVAQSTYNADGTFNAWFVNLKGEKISESSGNWSVKNDSLFVDFFYNNRDIKVGYQITETEEGFTGKSKFDWDNDGELDDFLLMKTKRIKIQ